MKKTFIALIALSAASFAFAGGEACQDKDHSKCDAKCSKECTAKDAKADAKDSKADAKKDAKPAESAEKK